MEQLIKLLQQYSHLMMCSSHLHCAGGAYGESLLLISNRISTVSPSVDVSDNISIVQYKLVVLCNLLVYVNPSAISHELGSVNRAQAVHTDRPYRSNPGACGSAVDDSDSPGAIERTPPLC